jgi:hypothetical protein
MTKNVSLGIAVIALAVAVFAVFNPTIVTHTEKTLGTAAGPEFTDLEVFHGSLVVGGQIVIISASSTITGPQTCNTSYVDFTALTSGVTLRTPSSTDLLGRCLNNIGDMVTFTINNNSGQTLTLTNGDANAATFVADSSTLVYPNASYATVSIQRTSVGSTTVYTNQLR